MSLLLEILLIGLAVASITMTISKSNVMEYPRIQVSKLGRWARELIHCPYCLSHWFAFGIVWQKLGLFPLERFILVSFGVVTIASLASLKIAQLFLALDEIDSEEEEGVMFDFGRKVRRVARRQWRRGKLDRETYRKIVQGSRNPDLVAKWQVAIENGVSGAPWIQKTGSDWREMLTEIWEWFLENWPEIMEILLTMLIFVKPPPTSKEK